MKPRRWIKTRYFRPQPVRIACEVCRETFEYVRRSKPRRYCLGCARDVRLKQMKICNESIRNLDRVAREKVSA